jgi:hypothetical protein
MVLEIVNTILLFFIFLLNYRILSIVNTLLNKNIITKSLTLADDIMSCDNCESCINCNNYNKNNCLNNNENNKNNENNTIYTQPIQNIYSENIYNDKTKLLEINKENKQKEWTEIQIVN